MMRKVFIVNRGSHDHSKAKKFGRLVYLSNGMVNRYATNNMIRMFKPQLEKSFENDYILITSLSVMSCIACCLFAVKHKRLNLLLYKPGQRDSDSRYVERIIKLEGDDE